MAARYSDNDVDITEKRRSEAAFYEAHRPENVSDDSREGPITRRLRQIEKGLAQLDEVTTLLEARISPTLTRVMENDRGMAEAGEDLSLESGMSEQLAFIADRLQKRVRHITALTERVEL